MFGGKCSPAGFLRGYERCEVGVRFAVRYHDAATFDAATGVSHERTEVRSPTGDVAEVDLWTGCYTPRELRLLLAAHGLVVDSIASVEPGAYGSGPASTESPEFLVVAHRP